MELLDQDGMPIKASERITKTIKASDRTRTHLNSPGSIQSEFKDEDDMKEKEGRYLNAQEKKIVQEMEKDKENGFDIEDINSILAFETGYTPIGTEVILKEVREDLKIGSIHLIEGSVQAIKKYMVITTGLLVDVLEKGDLVYLKATQGGSINAIKRIFKEVNFIEINNYDIAGILKPKDEIVKRIKAVKK